MKKILIIQGGGRANGNTAKLVKSFAKGAESAGHFVETISLIKNEVKGCLGCNACRYGKPCVQKDAFNEIVPKIKESDCIAISDENPPLGRYEKYPVKDSVHLMTSADNFFWTFEQAERYSQAVAATQTENRKLKKTTWLLKAENFGRTLYENN